MPELVQIAFKNTYHKFLEFELHAIAKVNEGYQRCSIEIKQFKNLSATPEEYIVHNS